MKAKFSPKRVWAILVRHLFSWPRDLESLAESFWWPSFDLFIWGLVTVYLQMSENTPSIFISFFLGAIVLWMFVYRSQQEMSFTFLKEVWDRNILNIFTTPLTVWEFLSASMILGIAKLTISALWMIFLAYILFQFNVFTLGFWFIPFLVNLLLVGWSAGFLINGLIVQYGWRVQSFAWTLILVIQPFSAVFYPVSVMPGWMQSVAAFIPTSYIFEGMRAVLIEGRFEVNNLLFATGLNLIYISLSALYFAHSFRRAKETGMIVKFS